MAMDLKNFIKEKETKNFQELRQKLIESAQSKLRIDLPEEEKKELFADLQEFVAAIKDEQLSEIVVVYGFKRTMPFCQKKALYHDFFLEPSVEGSTKKIVLKITVRTKEFVEKRFGNFMEKMLGMKGLPEFLERAVDGVLKIQLLSFDELKSMVEAGIEFEKIEEDESNGLQVYALTEEEGNIAVYSDNSTSEATVYIFDAGFKATT